MSSMHEITAAISHPAAVTARTVSALRRSSSTTINICNAIELVYPVQLRFYFCNRHATEPMSVRSQAGRNRRHRAHTHAHRSHPRKTQRTPKKPKKKKNKKKKEKEKRANQTAAPRWSLDSAAR